MSGPDVLALVALLLALAGYAVLAWRVLHTRPGIGWRSPPVETAATTTSQDGRLRALDRVVSGHLTAREPSTALAVQLRGLADRRLVLRHGVRWDTDPARTARLLGADTVALVDARPPQRMTLSQIDAVLRRIEDL
jgi:hypothetical protein